MFTTRMLPARAFRPRPPAPIRLIPILPTSATAAIAPSASIVIPTRARPHYLEVALASIAPQAAAAGAEILVVDDAGASPAIGALAARFGARYEPHPQPLGLNVARNTGVARSSGPLVAFVDDDVEVQPGWLDALLRAADAYPRAAVFAGPIRPRLEGGHRWTRHTCGREGPAITALDLGPHDTDRVRYAWGANMAVRRAALERIGPFDITLQHGGDEQEWQDRLLAAAQPGERAGRIVYVAAAALDHRRSAADARLRALARAAYVRGSAARRFDARRHPAGEPPPSLARELRTLVACAAHVVRRRCPAGLTMVAHSLGRLQQGLRERARKPALMSAAAAEDFLSGESGTVGGLDAVRRGLRDRLLDTRELLGGQRLRLDRAAHREPPRRRVLVLGVTRPAHQAMTAAIRTELARSRHDVELRLGPPGELGKFENLNHLLDAAPLADYDWLLVLDDDVVLPHNFLDRLLFLAERLRYDLVQPAHRARSHAAWRVTRRRGDAVAHDTSFVEIGPVTAFASSTFPTLLPFPQLRMGWGLDLHWAALARAHGWRCGVLDAVAITHAAAPAAAAYSREAAVAEARDFLAERPYVSAREAQVTLDTHRRW